MGGREKSAKHKEDDSAEKNALAAHRAEPEEVGLVPLELDFVHRYEHGKPVLPT
jgi:hypothetical protein